MKRPPLLWWIITALAISVLATLDTQGQMACDTNLDNRVTVAELVTGVNAALGYDCSKCDDAEEPCPTCREFLIYNGQRLNGSFCAINEEAIAYCFSVLCAQGHCSTVEEP